MTDYEIKLPKELLSSLMTESTGLAQLIGSVLDQVDTSKNRAFLRMI